MTWESITVSNKVVGHISAGIYRSPGGALRELVGNAFDANDARVIITTNWPSFDLLPGVLRVMQRRMIGSEEAYLERAFAEEYRRYTRRVRRWI